jgi:hypothetical protein
MSEGAMRHAAVTASEQFDDEHRCTEFTIDHGLDTSGDRDVFGAAICPGCEKPNALTGDPGEFRALVMCCMGCTRVLLLDGASLAAFATEVFNDVHTRRKPGIVWRKRVLEPLSDSTKA